MYIMASHSGILYNGFTNVLKQRVWQHKTNFNECFTSKYKCHKLVYYEEFRYVNDALEREKQVKRWRREKKVALIESLNPAWIDLAAEWYCLSQIEKA